MSTPNKVWDGSGGQAEGGGQYQRVPGLRAEVLTSRWPSAFDGSRSRPFLEGGLGGTGVRVPLAGPGEPGARYHLSGENGVCPPRPVPSAEPLLVCALPLGGPPNSQSHSAPAPVLASRPSCCWSCSLTASYGPVSLARVLQGLGELNELPEQGPAEWA